MLAQTVQLVGCGPPVTALGLSDQPQQPEHRPRLGHGIAGELHAFIGPASFSISERNPSSTFMVDGAQAGIIIPLAIM